MIWMLDLMSAGWGRWGELGGSLLRDHRNWSVGLWYCSVLCSDRASIRSNWGVGAGSQGRVWRAGRCFQPPARFAHMASCL